MPAASGAAVPRWKALLATGIRRLAVWGTGLLAALVALLALAQIVCLALCLLALVVLALCFLMASLPNYGVGLRIEVQPRMNVRLDLGKNTVNNQTLFYFNMTEAF